jgi:hypothetical protein
MMLNDAVLACIRGVRPPPLPHHIDLSIASLAVRVGSPDWNIAVSFSSIAPHHDPPIFRMATTRRLCTQASVVIPGQLVTMMMQL